MDAPKYLKPVRSCDCAGLVTNHEWLDIAQSCCCAPCIYAVVYEIKVLDQPRQRNELCGVMPLPQTGRGRCMAVGMSCCDPLIVWTGLQIRMESNPEKEVCGCDSCESEQSSALCAECICPCFGYGSVCHMNEYRKFLIGQTKSDTNNLM